MTSTTGLIRRIGRPVRRWTKQKLLDLQAPVSLRYFNNRRGLAENLRYRRYHQDCRRSWDAGSGEPSPEGDSLRRDGYVVIPPTPQRKELARRIESELDTSIRDPENLDPRFQDPSNPKLADAVDHLPNVTDLLDRPIANALEHFFGAHFKIYYIEPTRSVPAQGDLGGHWLWHSDNDPDPILKVMVYLTDVTESHGPFTSHDRTRTGRLLRAGFFNRNDAERFREDLEDENSYCRFVGEAGTAVIFDNNLIHRGWPVIEGHRDVVVFMVLPSKEPWNLHMKRMGNKLSLSSREHPTPVDPAYD